MYSERDQKKKRKEYMPRQWRSLGKSNARRGRSSLLNLNGSIQDSITPNGNGKNKITIQHAHHLEA